MQLTSEQKEEIEKLIIHEESQQVFSLADMMNMMKKLVICKKELMEIKCENHELKMQLKGKSGPENTPEVKQ